MKKLIAVLLALLCCTFLASTAFADLILPPDIVETEPPVVATAGETPASVSVTSSAAPSSSVSPTVYYLAIGVLVLAAAFVLFLLLRKKPA